MDGIQALGSLSGKLSGSGSLKGTITISATGRADAYTGDYKVTPQAFQTQTLETANKLLQKNIIIGEIPYYETENNSNGITAYIAKGD